MVTISVNIFLSISLSQLGVELNVEFKIESIRGKGSLLTYAKKHLMANLRQEAGGSSCDNYDCVISQLCSVQEMLRWKGGGQII